MEIKTKHRILGVLVLIGLVIILFPFFQGSKDIPAQSMSVKAPPFPDQSVQVTTGETSSTPIEIPGQAQSTASAIPTTPVIPIKNPLQRDDGIRQTPDDVISVVRPSVVNQKAEDDSSNASKATMTSDVKKAEAVELSSMSEEKDESKDKEKDNVQLTKDTSDFDESTDKKEANTVSDTQVKVDENDASEAKTSVTEDEKSDAQVASKSKKAALKPAPTMKNAVHIIKAPSAKIKAKVATNQRATIEEEGLFKLKSAVWVIQLGSFKNKTNALRLVNQLRASGYRAFIQQADANTRVFVGPENKQNAARTLADQLENDLHLKGIVISYKPLTL